MSEFLGFYIRAGVVCYQRRKTCCTVSTKEPGAVESMKACFDELRRVADVA